MEARLPDDKLSRLRSLVSSWQTKTCCRLQDLQSLIGSLHFACKVVAPGRPFLRRMIALTCGVSKPTSVIRLGKELRKDLGMWALFLTSWNGIKLLNGVHPSPLAMTPFPFSWMPLGPSGMVPTFSPTGFIGNGFHSTPQPFLQILVFHGRNCSPFT